MIWGKSFCSLLAKLSELDVKDCCNITIDVPLVYIVILNWNGWRLTAESLATIEAMDYPNFRVIVVDNGSTDGSPAYLRMSYPALTLIETGNNLGFTGGCNVGIEKALELGAEYVLLFNNDAKAAPGMLSRMVATAEEADAAICGARVMDERGVNILFNGRRWPAHIFNIEPLLSHNSVEQWSHSDGADGCAVLLRRDILEQRLKESGYVFDIGFFMYCEETDFCLYGIRNGYHCVVSYNAIAYHGLAKSSGGGANPRTYYYLTRNRIYLANRWLSLPWKIIFHLYYLPSRLLLQFRRSRAARAAVWRGLKDGYRGVKGIWERHGG